METIGEGEADTKSVVEKKEMKPAPLKIGMSSVWRARCITAYNPELLPPEPMPLHETVNLF